MAHYLCSQFLTHMLSLHIKASRTWMKGGVFVKGGGGHDLGGAHLLHLLQRLLPVGLVQVGVPGPVPWHLEVKQL